MNSDSTLTLLTREVPLIDVRSPVEFEQGALPASRNLPIMNDAERHRIGRCYKQQGHDAAVELGFELVHGHVRETRIEAWQQLLKAHPEAHLYCFRGGQRSGIAAGWLREAGTPVQIIEGGYKRLRRTLLGLADTLPQTFDITVVGGQTGTGKTIMVRDLESFALDLEGCANHRGSAYGALPTGQPSQVDFEHACTVRLLQLQTTGARRIVLEDESHRVGRVTVPPALFAAMADAPVAVIEEPLSARVERIFDEYVGIQHRLFAAIYGETYGFEAYAVYLRMALDAIRKRLGGARHSAVTATLESALAHHACGDLSVHRDWIEALLVEYYDPMYSWQLERKAERIVFRGDFVAVRDYLSAHREVG